MRDFLATGRVKVLQISTTNMVMQNEEREFGQRKV